jgi:hypothetical protein
MMAVDYPALAARKKRNRQRSLILITVKMARVLTP